MPTTPEQLIEQATRHAAHLEGLKTQYVNDYTDILSNINDDLLWQLSKDDLAKKTRIQFEKQLAAYKKLLEKQYNGEVLTLLDEQIAELAKYEAGFEIRSLENVVQNYNFVMPSVGQIETAIRFNPLSVTGADGGKLLDGFISDWNQSQIDYTINSIRSGYAQGATNATLISSLSKQLEKSDDIIETIVRTSLQHAANQSRAATWQANNDIIKMVQIVATLDSRTTVICRGLDGQKFPMDKGPRPPFHPRCRTTAVAVLDDRFAFLDDGATRAARDPDTGKIKKVDASETYYSWLKRQDFEFQKSIIGGTRASLLNNGGLTSERFTELQLNKTFKPNTLKQMYELEPLAFARAGIKL